MSIGPAQIVLVPNKDEVEMGSETQPIRVEKVSQNRNTAPKGNYAARKAYITLNVNLYSNTMPSPTHSEHNCNAFLING